MSMKNPRRPMSTALSTEARPAVVRNAIAWSREIAGTLGGTTGGMRVSSGQRDRLGPSEAAGCGPGRREHAKPGACRQEIVTVVPADGPFVPAPLVTADTGGMVGGTMRIAFLVIALGQLAVAQTPSR